MRIIIQIRPPPHPIRDFLNLQQISKIIYDNRILIAMLIYLPFRLKLLTFYLHTSSRTNEIRWNKKTCFNAREAKGNVPLSYIYLSNHFVVRDNLETTPFTALAEIRTYWVTNSDGLSKSWLHSWKVNGRETPTQYFVTWHSEIHRRQKSCTCRWNITRRKSTVNRGLVSPPWESNWPFCGSFFCNPIWSISIAVWRKFVTLAGYMYFPMLLFFFFRLKLSDCFHPQTEQVFLTELLWNKKERCIWVFS